MEADARYRSYLQVLGRQAVSGLLRDPVPDRSDALEQAFARATSPDHLNRLLAVDAQTQLPDDLLALTDRMSMAVSLEARVPLLTHPLVEWSWQIAPSLKLADQGDRGKLVLRELFGRAGCAVLPQVGWGSRQHPLVGSQLARDPFGGDVCRWIPQPDGGIKPLVGQIGQAFGELQFDLYGRVALLEFGEQRPEPQAAKTKTADHADGP